MTIIDRLLTLPQYLAPQVSMTRFVWWLTRCRNSTVKSFLIWMFRKFYDVNMHEAERQDPRAYLSFNDFFTRALNASARQFNTGEPVLLSPADGAISQIGRISGENLPQAKGRTYTLAALFANDPDVARQYEEGHFATIYLAPHDYHRVHSPAAGRILSVRYIPGKLFSVNHRTARCVDSLFALNERVVVEMEAECGRLALILVGAMLVSSMELTCCDLEAAVRAARPLDGPVHIAVAETRREIARGAEIGRFNMGSTVIVLAEAGALNWAPQLKHGSTVQVGQAIANLTPRC